MTKTNYWWSSGATQNGGNTPDPGEVIDGCLRFRGSNGLTCNVRTNGEQDWTFSAWLKKTINGNNTSIFTPRTLAGSSVGLRFRLNTPDNIGYQGNATDFDGCESTALFRDPGAWYNVVCRCDFGTDLCTIFVNGEQVAQGATTANMEFNSIMRFASGNEATHPGGLNYADVYLVEEALGPECFGRENDNGVWVARAGSRQDLATPRPFNSQDYGSNGFHLTFEADTITTTDGVTTVADQAPTGTGHTAANNFTATNFETTDTTSENFDILGDSPSSNWGIFNTVAPPLSGTGVVLDGGMTVRTGPTSATIFKPPGQTVYFEIETGFVNNERQWSNWWNLIQIINGQTQEISGGGNNVAPATMLENGGFAFDISANVFANNVDETVEINSTNLAANDIIGVQIDDDNITVSINGTVSSGINNRAFANNFDDGMYLYFRNAGNSANTTEWMHINFGQRPFSHRPNTLGNGNNLQTQNMPEIPIRDGREHFRTVTTANADDIVSGPVTEVTTTERKNWTLTGQVYTNVVGFNESLNGYSEDEISGYILNQAIGRNALGTGSQCIAAPNNCDVHVSFAMDPAVANVTATFSGGCDYSCGSLSGRAIPTWNSEQFNFSHASYVEKTTTSLTEFGFGTIPWTAPYSASLSWVTAMREGTDNTGTNVFLDDEVTLTFDSADDIEGFLVGQLVRKQGDDDVWGNITAIDDNVVTLASNSTWAVNDRMVHVVDDILPTAQGTFESGLWWCKSTTASSNHQLVDIIRGNRTALLTPTLGAEQTYSHPAGTQVAWCWNAPDAWASTDDNVTAGTIASSGRRDATAGFSIVSYEGNGVEGATVAHGLRDNNGAATPDWIIVKNRESSDEWHCWHSGLGGGQWTIRINSTAGRAEFNSWDETVPNANHITLGPVDGTNDDDIDFIAYCWTAVPGYSAMGTFEGNVDTNGPYIYTGFRPAWVMIKQFDNDGNNWIIQDSLRSANNPSGNSLYSSAQSSQDTSADNNIDFLSNGFKIRNSNNPTNQDNRNYLYVCFAENPFGGSNTIPVTAR